MPNDPLSPVARGDPLAITAAGWNDVLAATGEIRRGARPRGLLGDPSAHGPVRALVLNDTGADLREYKPAKVVGAGGYDLTDDTAGPHWADNPLLTLDVPAAATDVIAVTLEAIPDGEIGWAAIGGWTLCDVDISSSGHGYASPTTDTDALVSAATGSIRIIATGTGTARRTAVYLGDQVAAAAGTSLNSQNTDGTQVDSTTTDLRFDKATGVQVTQGSGGTAGQSIVSGINATPTQVGMVSTGTQIFEGEKRFNADVVRTENTNPASSGTAIWPACILSLPSSATAQVYATTSSVGSAGLAMTGLGVSGNVTATVTATSANGSTYALLSSAQDVTDSSGTAYLYLICDNDAAAGAFFMAVNPVDGFRGFNFFGGTAPTATVDATYDLYADPGATSRLYCAKDFEFDSDTIGPIIRSPDNSRWRVVVDNSGNLSTEAA